MDSSEYPTLVKVYIDGVVEDTEEEPTTEEETTVEETTVEETTVEETTVEETTEAPSDRVWGDASGDGEVLVNDAILVMAYTTNPDASTISAEGLANADVYQSGDGVGITDATAIQKYLTKLIGSLPESYL